jgi:hypothetical protein
MKIKIMTVLVAVTIIGFLLSSCAGKNEFSDQIKVTSPVRNQLVESPIIIEGEARGTWFFEGTFPVTLLDADGNEVAIHYAQTDAEWMTEDFISFYASLEFEKPDTDSGTLLLIKNNPSDMRELDAQIEIPVRFE